jgi:predicted nucleic acid-binding protein
MSMGSSRLIFVDTWAWLALANRKDAYHSTAQKCYAEIKADGLKLVTSDYVLDETITALFRNVAYKNAVQFVESLFLMVNGARLSLERITESRFEAAWLLRKRYQDKPDISFTDLTSIVLMQELAINRVFTGDTHFEEANLGFEILLRMK